MAVYGMEWVAGSHGPNPGPIYDYKEGSGTQTFKKGQLVIYDTSADGIVTATLGTYTASLGLALEDASGTTGTVLPVLVFMPGQLFSATLSTDGYNTTAAHATTNIGLQFALIASAESGETTKWVVDDNNLTDPWVTVLQLDARDTAGTSGGRCIFEIMWAAHTTRGQA